MRPEQERVKNLLTDTVTLLCKNGLTYKQDLKIEALIGITVDSDDVFIVHINERFDPHSELHQSDTNISASTHVSDEVTSEKDQSNSRQVDRDSPAQLKSNSKNTEDGQIVSRPSSTSQKDTSDVCDSQTLSDDGSKDVVIKIEDCEEGVEFLGADTPALNSPSTVAHRASMIAGQRRVPQKRQYGHQGLADSESSRHTYSGGFNLPDNDGRLWDSEPASKRQMMEDYFPFMTDQTEMSAQLMFDASGQLVPTDGSSGRAGCSNWSPASTSSRTGIQSDMLRKSMSSEAKFPNFALVNYHAKEPLVKYIVEPVLSNGGLACSFRLGWFGKSGENLVQVWEQLVYLRSLVDVQVCDTPGVAFVLSALSGTVSQKAGFPRKTYPAVAYWVATQDQTFQESYILPKMHSLNLGSTVKQLHSTNNIDKQKMASSLFVVVKDNSESYVRRMADASAMLCGGEAAVTERLPLVKVFVKDPRYWALLEEAKAKLEQVNFSVHLEKLFS